MQLAGKGAYCVLCVVGEKWGFVSLKSAGIGQNSSLPSVVVMGHGFEATKADGLQV